MYASHIDLKFIKACFNFYKNIKFSVLVKATKQENIPTWKEVIGDAVLIEYKLQFAVNFSYGKFKIIILQSSITVTS